MPTGHFHLDTGDLNSSPRVCMVKCFNHCASQSYQGASVVKMCIRWEVGFAVTGALSKDVMCVEREK